jgi:hypothetical protein
VRHPTPAGVRRRPPRALLLAAPAHAFVRTTTSVGAPMFWNKTILNITAYTGESAQRAHQLRDAGRGSRRRRSVGRNYLDCTSLEIRVNGSLDPEGTAQLDGMSQMSFRREEWCKEPRAESDPCYDPFALAVTSGVRAQGGRRDPRRRHRAQRRHVRVGPI